MTHSRILVLIVVGCLCAEYVNTVPLMPPYFFNDIEGAKNLVKSTFDKLQVATQSRTPADEELCRRVLVDLIYRYDINLHGPSIINFVRIDDLFSQARVMMNNYLQKASTQQLEEVRDRFNKLKHEFVRR
uniref:Uncharacterized protein n=1 Tax=Panagrellus redivivus TaxID=6233 RepID=A0A7E4ZQT3_PANRE